MARLNMSMIYVCETPGQPPVRKITGLRVLSAGEYSAIGEPSIPETYIAKPFRWGSGLGEAEPLAAVLLTDCLNLAKTSHGSPVSAGESIKDLVSRLHQKFAEEFICPADPKAAFSIDWLKILTWLDDQISDEELPDEQPRRLAGCFERIRDFDNLLLTAFDDGGDLRKHRVSREIWESWNIETFAELCLATGQLNGKRLQYVIDHFLDLKLKLYMLAEVDVPTYASAKEVWGLNRDRPGDTPHGFTTQLSEEVTLIVKSRAIWESIMDLVSRYVDGRETRKTKVVDEYGESYSSKKTKFFPWVAQQPLWTSLATFEPLVAKLDKLRTSEMHKYSRVRTDFTRMTLQPIEQCVELVNAVLTYVLDQFVAAIALRCSSTYDVVEKSQITLG
jgi:hypothetical protein